MRKGIRGLAVALALGLGAVPAAATLIGDQIEGSLVFTDFPQLGNCFDPADVANCRAPAAQPPFAPDSGIQPLAIVTENDAPFPEFVFDDKGFLIVTADVDESSVRVRVENTSTIPPQDAQTPFGWQIQLTDLDWTDVSGIISAASVLDDTLFPGLTVSVINGGTGLLIDNPGRNSAFDADQLLVWNANGEFVADIAIDAVHTPEPGALLLLAGGLAALAWRNRRY